MKTNLSEQQTAFYTQNGMIELEIPHVPIPFDNIARDVWRTHSHLKTFLIKKLGPLALTLTGRKQLLLAFDQVFTKENRPTTACPLKEIASIQGLSIAIAIADKPIVPEKRSPLGILPTPTLSSNILFFKPEIILDWPHISSTVYLAVFALPNAVYIHNAKDPATHTLKKMGLNFNDPLKNDTHPFIM